MMHVRKAIGGAVLVGLLILTGCSSGSEPNTTTTGGLPSPPAGGPGGFNSEQFQQIRNCLKAAGLEHELPSVMPSGMPATPPSGGAPPTGPPPDMSSPGAGGQGALLQNPKVQQALKACGIEMPGAPTARTG